MAVAISEFARLSRQYGLILLDLDHFKQINDNYGHKVGDQILIELVPVLQSMLRQSDQVFRFGGEEFVVLVADIKQADLERLAEKLRAGVQRKIILPDGAQITTSIGVAMQKLMKAGRPGYTALILRYMRRNIRGVTGSSQLNGTSCRYRDRAAIRGLNCSLPAVVMLR